MISTTNALRLIYNVLVYHSSLKIECFILFNFAILDALVLTSEFCITIYIIYEFENKIILRTNNEFEQTVIREYLRLSSFELAFVLCESGALSTEPPLGPAY